MSKDKKTNRYNLEQECEMLTDAYIQKNNTIHRLRRVVGLMVDTINGLERECRLQARKNDSKHGLTTSSRIEISGNAKLLKEVEKWSRSGGSC